MLINKLRKSAPTGLVATPQPKLVGLKWDRIDDKLNLTVNVYSYTSATDATNDTNSTLVQEGVKGQDYRDVRALTPTTQYWWRISYVDIWDNESEKSAVATAVFKGVQTTDIEDNAVITSKILDGAIKASKIDDNAVIAAKIANGVIDAAKFASSIAPVEILSALPSTGNYAGRQVFLTTDNKLYRYNGSAFTASVASTDLSGTISGTQIAAGAINVSKFASGLSPVEVLSALPSTGNYAGRMVFLTTDSKLYRHNGTSFIANVATSDLSGTISGTQLADGAVNATKFATGVAPVEILSALPSTGNYAGRQVFLTTDNKLYRYNGSAFTASVPAADISGTVSATQIADGSISAAKFSNNVKPVEVLSALPTSGNVVGRTVFLTTDNKLYRYNGTAFIASVATADLSGTINASQIADGVINAAKFATGFAPVEIVGSLPSTGNFAGRTVFLTTDNKLYRYNGSSFTSAVQTADLSGTITSTQITDGAITTAKMTANSINGDRITAGTLNADKLVANSITGGQIRGGSISATELGVDSVTAEKILAGSVTTDKMTANSINGDRITAGTLNADKLVANSITGGQIQGGSISATELAADSVTAKQLLLTDFSNIVDNGWQQGVKDGWTINGLQGWFLSTTVSDGDARGWMLSSNERDQAYSSWISVNAGEAFFLSVWVNNYDSVVPAQLMVNMQTPTGTNTWATVATSAAGTQFALISGRYVVPAGVTRIRMLLQSNRTAGSGGANVYWSRPIMRRAANAEMVVDGAITTIKMTANSINGDRISAGTLDASKITANSITAGQIQAGSITANELAVNSVTAKQLVVSDWTNLFKNPQISGGSIDGWRVTNGNTIASVAKTGSVAPISTIPNAYAIQLTSFASTSDAIGVDWIPVREGDEFFYEFDYAAVSGATGSLYAMLRSKTASGTESPVSLGTLSPSTTWQTFSGNYTVPAGVVQIYVGMRVAGGGAGSFLGTNFRFNRRSNGELIVDGSITTNKMVANSINGDRITAGTLDADRIVANSITAGQIQTGAISTDELAAGAVTAEKLAIGRGSNLLSNTDFLAGVVGWTLESSSQAASFSMSLRTDTYAAGGAALQIQQINGNQSVEYGIQPTINGSPYVAVQAGNWYETSIYYYGHRCNGLQVYIQWVDGTGNHISYSSWPVVSAAQNGNPTKLLSNYQRFWGKAQAPANAQLAKVFFRHKGTVSGGSDSYLWLKRPFFGETQVNQTEPTPWSEGGLTFIQGGNIVTGAISTDKMVANSINGDRITANTLNADRIVSNSITAGQIQAGAISATEIAAGAIIASKIAIGALSDDNLIPDPNMEDQTLSLWTGGSGGSISNVAATDAPSGGRAVEFNRGVSDNTVSMNRYLPMFVIEGGVEYYGEFTIKGNSASPNGSYLRIQYHQGDAAKTEISSFDIVSNGAIPSVYTTYGQKFTPPAGAKYARIRIYHHNTSTVQSMFLSDIQIKKSLPGTLVVNGSITGSQIAANTISAGNIAAQAITASKLFVGDTSNIFRDPECIDLVGWSASPGTVVREDNTYGQSRYKMTVAATTAAVTMYTGGRDIPVEANKPFFFSAYVGSDNGVSASFTLNVTWYSMASNGTTTTISTSAIGTYTGTSVTKISKILTAPANARRAEITLVKASSASAVKLAMTEVIVRRASNGELIVDGSITADKIQVSSLQAVSAVLGSVDISDAIIGTLEVDSINIKSDAILPSKFYTRDFTNLVRDSEMVEASMWSLYTFSNMNNMSFALENNQTSEGIGYSVNRIRVKGTPAASGNSYKLGIRAPSADIPINGGSNYVFSAVFTRTADTMGTPPNVGIRVTWWARSGNFFVAMAYDSSVIQNLGGITTVSKQFQAPSGASRASFEIYFEGVAASTSEWNVVISSPTVKQAINTNLLVNGAVGNEQIAIGAILSDRISDGSVLTAKIGDLQVTNGKIATGAVSNSKLADGSVDRDKLASGAVAAQVEVVTNASYGSFGTSEQTIQSAVLNHGASTDFLAVWAFFKNTSGATRIFQVSLQTSGGTSISSFTATVEDEELVPIFGILDNPTGSSTTIQLRVTSSSTPNNVTHRRICAMSFR